ncbi:MAG: hypothetical protein HYY13_06275 [Nitrospirae bacterium]|nr:hypothetical protein [Nitrospirota bacterium]
MLGRRRGGAIFCALLLSAAATAEAPAAGSPPRSVWRAILPLGGAGATPNVERAFEVMSQLAAPLKKFLFVARYEPDLDKTLDLILLNSTSMDLEGLYARKDIPWVEDADGRRRFRFSGGVEAEAYRLAFAREAVPLLKFGDTEAEFSIQPVKQEDPDDIFLIRYRQSWYMGPLSTESLGAIHREWLRFLDVSDVEVSDPAAADAFIRGQFVASFPNLSAAAGELIKVDSVVEPASAPDGTRLTRVRLALRFDEETLKRKYPHFLKAHRALSASNMRVTTVDGEGRPIVEFQAGGGVTRLTLLTRGGRVFPMGEDGQAAASEGEYLDELSHRPHAVAMGAWIKILGMGFGMDGLRYDVAWEEQKRHGHLAAVPRPILPPVIRQLFGPFIRPYYEAMYRGNGGKGIEFEGYFRPAGGGNGGHVLTHAVEIPLQDSTLFSYFFKIGNRFRRSLPEEGKAEFLSIVDRLTGALRADFERARDCYRRTQALICA